jgi:hypothetical protein
MSDIPALQLVSWYQVDATGAIVASGTCQSIHIGDIIPYAGASMRLGRANGFSQYEDENGALQDYTPGEQALRMSRVPGKVWNARSRRWT